MMAGLPFYVITISFWVFDAPLLLDTHVPKAGAHAGTLDFDNGP